MKFKKLLSSFRLPTDAQKIVAAIEDEESEIKKIAARREEIYAANDASVLDGDFAALDATAAELHTLEQRETSAQARLPLLHEKLRLARAIERATAIKVRQDEFREMFARVRDSALAFAKINTDAVALYTKTRAEFGDDDTSRHFPRIHYAGLPAADLIASWQLAIERDPRLFAPPPEPVAAPAPSPVPAPKKIATTNPANMVVTDEFGGGPGDFAKMPKAPDDTSPLTGNEVRVKVLVSGFCSANDRPGSHRGHVVKMDRVAARYAAMNGAVRIIEGDDAPAVSGANKEAAA